MQTFENSWKKTQYLMNTLYIQEKNKSHFRELNSEKGKLCLILGGTLLLMQNINADNPASMSRDQQKTVEGNALRIKINDSHRVKRVDKRDK